MRKEKILNLPNIITIIRFFLIPLVVMMFIYERDLYALILYIIAYLSDILDGYLARKNNLITNFGKLMDPLADKLMLLTVIVAFYVKGRITNDVLILIAVKEGIMILGGAILYKFRNQVVFANWFGKIGAGAFFAAVVLTFFHQYVTPYDRYIMYIAITFSFAAMFQYGYYNVLMLMKKKNNAVDNKEDNQ